MSGRGHRVDPGAGREDRRLQGIEGFLRSAQEDFGRMAPGALEERRRPAPFKIVTWVAALLFVVGGAWLVAGVIGHGSLHGSAAPGTLAGSTDPDPAIVILVAGSGGLSSPSGKSYDPAVSPLSVGDGLGPGTRVTVARGGAAAIGFESGITVLARQDAVFTIEESRADRHVIRIESGALTLRTGAGPGERASIEVVAGGSTVRPSAGIVVIESSGSALGQEAPDPSTAALLGLLTAGKPAGRLEVDSEVPGRLDVGGATLGPLPVSAMLPRGRYGIAVLAEDGSTLRTDDVDIEADQTLRISVAAAQSSVLDAVEVASASGDDAQKKPAPGDIVSRIRQALAAGDVDEALALVKKNEAGHGKDASFLDAAGDTYLRAGLDAEAVEAYLAAAARSGGKDAEGSLLDAARVSLEKRKDLDGASDILALYWSRFPHGFFELEASFLNARLLVRQKRYADARDRLEALLAMAPEGYLSTKAHLLLGSILVTYMSDCKAALPHLAAVKKAAPGGKFASEADLFVSRCGG